ncbi:MAG: hypothetical protein IT379_26435 [Deltaproteobacteria bacterium]|nr:hypothetical protein [Deltaproteobacteria bacterium]
MRVDAMVWLTIVLSGCSCSDTARRDAQVEDARADTRLDRDLGLVDTGIDSGTDAHADVSEDMAAPDAGPDFGVGCDAGFTACLEADGVVRCVDLLSDDCHCGACGHVADCVNGWPGPCDGVPELLLCFDPAGPGWVCLSGVSSLYCVDMINDPMNCGGCGARCDTGQRCLGGACEDIDGGT